MDEIQIGDIAAEFNLKETDLNRSDGPIDLLIGTDHPTFQVGETRESTCSRYIARKSPLGWVVFGGRPSDEKHGAVFHIKMASPAMGVQYNDCQCQPINISKNDRDEYNVIYSSCEKVSNQRMISYPWKRNPQSLPNNRTQAE